MFMAFLMERRYAPYAKWFGIAFKKWLSCADALHPMLFKALREKNWIKRQEHLVAAYAQLGKMHNDLHLTPPIRARVKKSFHGRSYPTMHVEDYIFALEASIRNAKLREMKYPLGSIDQFIDHARINQTNYVYTELGNIIA
jgi:hypothetical protein